MNRPTFFRQLFLKTRKERICQKCGSTYLPNSPSQKFCEKCGNKPNHDACKCGRHSAFLDEFKRCSFCRDRDQRIKAQQRYEVKHGIKDHYCHECPSWISKEEFEQFKGLCPTCYVRKYERKD